MANAIILLRRNLIAQACGVEAVYQEIERFGDVFVPLSTLGGTLIKAALVLPINAQIITNEPELDGHPDCGIVMAVDGDIVSACNIDGTGTRSDYVFTLSSELDMDTYLRGLAHKCVAIVRSGEITMSSSTDGCITKSDYVFVLSGSISTNTYFEDSGTALLGAAIPTNGSIDLDAETIPVQGNLTAANTIISVGGNIINHTVENGVAITATGTLVKGGMDFDIPMVGFLETLGDKASGDIIIPDTTLQGSITIAQSVGLSGNINDNLYMTGFMEFGNKDIAGSMNIEDTTMLGGAIIVKVEAREGVVDDRIVIQGAADVAGVYGGQMMIADELLTGELELAYYYTTEENEAGGISYDITADDEVCTIDGASVVIGGIT